MKPRFVIFVLLLLPLMLTGGQRNGAPYFVDIYAQNDSLDGQDTIALPWNSTSYHLKFWTGSAAENASFILFKTDGTKDTVTFYLGTGLVVYEWDMPYGPLIDTCVVDSSDGSHFYSAIFYKDQ